MLSGLVGFSIRFRGVIVALACVAVGYGAWIAARARFDVFPEFAPPLVVIQTESPGLAPEQVEQLVTRPIENAVNGIGGLQSVRSQSIQGLSVVTVTFQDGTDIYRARQLTGEALTQVAGQLPQGVLPPVMAPLTSATSSVLNIGLTSTTRSPMDLRTFADWTLRPRLLGVPGVASVVIFGGDVRQLQVQVNPRRLVAYGLSLSDVLAAARKSTGIRGAGFIENESQRIVIQTQGQSLSARQLGQAIVATRSGSSIRLEDVARVVAAAAPKAGDATVMGGPGVVVMVSSQYGANTLEVTEAVEKALDDMKPAFAAAQITLHPALFRPANFINTAVHNVDTSLLLGGVLVAAVLFLFLFNLRTAFISLTAIPLSLLIAVIVLDRMGLTLNTLTLGGLAIAIGEVVDDAIIDVENIFRRLRESQAGPTPQSAFRIVLNASIEVRSAVIYATFVVALVFLPVIAMTGIEGRLFAPIGIAYILAILASLAVALTVTPALSYFLLSKSAKGASEPPFANWVKVRYRRWLASILHRNRLLYGSAAVLVIAAAAMLPFFGGSFLPEFEEGHFIVHMSAVPGTSLQQSLSLGRLVSLEILKNPNVRTVSQQIGRAELGTDTWGSNYSEFDVDLKPIGSEDAETVQGELRLALAKFPGLTFAINSFLSERIEETISGATAAVVVNIYGDDLNVLDLKAQEVARVLSGVGGAADVQLGSPSGTPQRVVKLRPERLRQFGFDPMDVLDAVQTAYQGSAVAQSYQGNSVFDVTVILDPRSRRDPQQVGSLLLRSPDGRLVPLRQLANVYGQTGRYQVLHDSGRRLQIVTCNVAGRPVASFVREARARIASHVRFPAGTYPVFTGAAEAQTRARNQILLHSLIAGIGIVLLLSIVMGNWRNLLLVLVNIPFALIGGVLVVFVTGGWLSVGSLVGFVTLFGITTRNSIMMISHFEHLVAVEGVAWGEDAALRGASERVVPVLMTALVTALGLLPLAIGSGSAGREIEGPMALVILGGLATSTLLNLLVLPALALKYGRFQKPSPHDPTTPTPVFGAAGEAGR